MALEITDANFEELVLKSDKPVLVDFWAEWCGPCRMVGPVVEELAKEFEGKAVIGKVNVDHNPDKVKDCRAIRFSNFPPALDMLKIAFSTSLKPIFPASDIFNI